MEVILSFSDAFLGGSVCILTYCLKEKETSHPIINVPHHECPWDKVGGRVVVKALTSFYSRKITFTAKFTSMNFSSDSGCRNMG